MRRNKTEIRTSKTHTQPRVWVSRIRKPFFGFVISTSVLSLLISLILPVFGTVSAAGEADLSSKALSYATVNALKICIRDEGQQEMDREGFVIAPPYINDAHAKSGDWWRTEGSFYWGTTDGAARNGSYLNSKVRSSDKGGDGKSLCNDILKTGVSLWGYSSAIDILCDAGVNRNDGSPCRESSDKFGDISGYADKIYQTILKKAFGGSEPTLYDKNTKGYPGLYLLYLSAFTKGCQATPSTSSADNKYVYDKIKVVGQGGTITETRFVGGVANDTTRFSYTDTSFTELNPTCKRISEKINEHATAYALYLGDHPDETPGSGTGIDCKADPSAKGCGDDQTSSCQVEGIGWIICPVVTFIAKVTDEAYKFITSLLAVNPLFTAGEGSAETYKAWGAMRTIANVAFVIAFLFIIFSQLTGVGVSNYGVKKMLPRIIIAAVLVNISYWICAIAVDISNILGSSMYTLFGFAQDNVAPVDVPGTDAGSGWEGIAGGLLAGGAAIGIALYVGLSAFIPALLAAALAIVTVFLVLVLRQALIILLIVISPLAFVAFLLPNTEDLFTKWRKMLTTLLLMYPIIAGIFGASALASTIVMAGASGEYKTVIQIAGACIAIIPLAITPIVMRAAGGVLNRFGGIINNPNKGPFDRLRKSGQKYREGRQNLRNTRSINGTGPRLPGRGGFKRWQARREAIDTGRQNEYSRAKTEYVADAISENTKAGRNFNNAVAGGTSFAGMTVSKASDAATQRGLASAINTQAKLETDEVSAASVVIKNAKLSQSETRTIALGGSVSKDGRTYSAQNSPAVQKAAMQQTVASNDIDGINALWNQSKSWAGKEGDSLRSSLADSLQSASGRPTYLGQGAIAQLRTNAHANVQETVESAIKANAYSAEKIASADKDELGVVAHVLKVNHDIAATDPSAVRVSDDERQQIMLNADRALSDEKLKNVVSKNIEQITNIRDFKGPGTPPSI